MKRLKLRNCIINSCSLFTLANFCPNLQYLDVRSSTYLSEDCYKYAAAEARVLGNGDGSKLCLGALELLHARVLNLRLFLDACPTNCCFSCSF
jgi:hypothetical protein